MAEGYAHATGRPGVAMVTSGPGGDQHRHAAVRRVHGLDPDGRDHRPGAVRGDRHRRVPGVRHRRHHACRSPSTTGSSPTPQDIPRVDPRGVPRRDDRPARPGARRHPEGHVAEPATMEWYWPETVDLPGYKPTTKGHPKQIKEAARLILRGAAAGDLRRRRHPQGARRRGAARAGRAHRHPRRHDADGARRVPRRPPAVPRHAGHARQLHRGHVDAEGRPARSRSGSRFDDRVTGKVGDVRARRQDHPRRHRPRRAGQGAPARRADRRRLPARDRGARQGGQRDARRGTSAARPLGVDAARSAGWQEQFPLTYEQSEDGDALKPQFVHRDAARPHARRHASSCRASASTRCGRASTGSSATRTRG